MASLTHLLALAAGSFVGVAQAQICTPFTDVPAASGFCADIQWMYNRGIAQGCTATTYCPSQYVRRDQLAAFLSRLADNAVFQQGGNAFGATAVLGTTDARAIEIVVEGERALRIWNVSDGRDGVNMLAGHSANVISRTCGVFGCPGDPVRGGVIAGGGSSAVPNRVTDSWSTVGGGEANIAGNENASSGDAAFATVGGGRFNTASGLLATIPGGSRNEAAGTSSFAAGYGAQALADGCFVWADYSSPTHVICLTPNQFLARAVGGFALRTNVSLTTGCTIPAGGGMWNCSSSRELKDDFEAIDPRAILDGVVKMPISSWRYRDEIGRPRHVGPTAEDFRDAFGLGDSSRDIGLIDGQGVALAAIKGLNAKLEATIAAQQRKLEAQAAELAALKATLDRIAAGR
jgi:hypothetical protein